MSDLPRLADVEVAVRATPFWSNHIIVWRVELLRTTEGIPQWALPDGTFTPGTSPFEVMQGQAFRTALSAVEWAEEHNWVVICLVPLE
jgi:hypothetical protein